MKIQYKKNTEVTSLDNILTLCRTIEIYYNLDKYGGNNLFCFSPIIPKLNINFLKNLYISDDMKSFEFIVGDFIECMYYYNNSLHYKLTLSKDFKIVGRNLL